MEYVSNLPFVRFNLTEFEIARMSVADFSEVGSLIHNSTNYWYKEHTGNAVFNCSPRETELFCTEYEALDPGCCLVLRTPSDGTIVASCFYHPRPTHISLGILNVHPDYFGRGAARQLLNAVIEIGSQCGLPVRLVSSLMNLDSFSLYNRNGFIPRAVFQDMVLPADATRLQFDASRIGDTRDAQLGDVENMVRLEHEQCGIDRHADFRHILNNRAGIWHVSVMNDTRGRLLGFLASCVHPAHCMLGPGCMLSDEVAEALICRELRYRLPHQPLLLVPSAQQPLLARLYARGATNLELHTLQCRGEWIEPQCIVMPSFLPESM